MNCPICSTVNPDSNLYCGQCGTALNSSSTQLGQQIETVVRRTVRDSDVLATEVTNKVQDQIERWGKVLGLAAKWLAAAAAVFIATLAIFGVTSYESAKSKIENAATTASDNLNKAAQQKQTDLANQENALSSKLQQMAQPVEAQIQAYGPKEQSLNAKFQKADNSVNVILTTANDRMTALRNLQESSPNAPLSSINSQLLQPFQAANMGFPSVAAQVYGLTVAIPPYDVGSTGDGVIAIQTRLQELDCYSGQINGVYDPATADAVKAFKSANPSGPLEGFGVGEFVPTKAEYINTKAPTLPSTSEGSVGMNEWSGLFSVVVHRCVSITPESH